MNDYTETIKKYEKKLRLQGLADTTIQSYSTNLYKFLQIFGSGKISYQQLSFYFNALLIQGTHESTYNQIMYSVKHYYENFLRKKFPESITKLQVPLVIINLPKQNIIIDAIRLLGSHQDYTITNWKNRTISDELREKIIILSYYDIMARRTEATKLLTKDFDFIRNSVIVRRGKGNKNGIVKISELTKNMILNYLAVRPEQNSPYLFPAFNSETRYRSKNYMSKVVKRAGILVGYDYWHPHLLRHAGATHLLRKTHDIYQVKEQLRHSSITSTLRYIHSGYDIEDKQGLLDDMIVQNPIICRGESA